MKRCALLVVLLAACGGDKKDDSPAPVSSAPTNVESTKKLPAEAPDPSIKTVDRGVEARKRPPPPPQVPEGDPPPDGKYEKVQVEGVTVPMVQVMQSGTIVLVDTDGKKPRTWEEQYKKKTVTKKGQFDVHKTDANKNGKFDDDPIDKEGLWVIDNKGNITKH